MTTALLLATAGAHALVGLVIAVVILLAILFAIFYVGRLLTIPEPVLVIVGLLVAIAVLLYLADGV